MNQVKPIHADHAQSKAYRFNTDIVAPPKVQKRKIEMVPGLGDLDECFEFLFVDFFRY